MVQMPGSSLASSSEPHSSSRDASKASLSSRATSLVAVTKSFPTGATCSRGCFQGWDADGQVRSRRPKAAMFIQAAFLGASVGFWCFDGVPEAAVVAVRGAAVCFFGLASPSRSTRVSRASAGGSRAWSRSSSSKSSGSSLRFTSALLSAIDRTRLDHSASLTSRSGLRARELWSGLVALKPQSDAAHVPDDSQLEPLLRTRGTLEVAPVKKKGARGTRGAIESARGLMARLRREEAVLGRRHGKPNRTPMSPRLCATRARALPFLVVRRRSSIPL